MTGGSAAGIGDITELAREAGLRRIHVLAWRDLVDIEAGGSEVHAAKILALWAEAGLEVVMRTSYAQGHPYEGDRDGYHLVRKHGRFMVFPTTVVGELAGGHGPRDGLVEIWNGVPFLSPLWAKGPKIAWVHHVHRDMWDMVLEPQLARAGKVFEHRIAPPLYRRMPVVTLSESSRHELIDYLGLRPAQISVVPPGIDERFQPGETRSPVPMVLSVGRLMPSKRVDELVRIVAQVRTSVPDLQLVVVGDGYERPALEAQVAALGAEGWVRIAGRVSDRELLTLYRRAWVVASASIAEGWGMTLTEAAACGTPVGGHRHRRPSRLGRGRALGPPGERRPRARPRPHRRAHRRRAARQAVGRLAPARRHPHVAGDGVRRVRPAGPRRHPPCSSAVPMSGHPPVVLVHGLATSSARTWGDNGWLDLLADAGRTALPLDMMGHGTADRPTDPAAYDRLEEDLLDRFPEGPVDAIGFSHGARTLLTIATDHPDRFHSLVLAGVGTNLFRPTGQLGSLGGVFDGSVAAEDPTTRYFSTLADAPDQDREALAALVRRPHPIELTDERLARVSCPVLVVIGDRDFAGPADPLVEKLPDARLVVLRNVDHFATPKDFGFIDAALEFLGAGL